MNQKKNEKLGKCMNKCTNEWKKEWLSNNEGVEKCNKQSTQVESIQDASPSETDLSLGHSSLLSLME